MKKALAIVILVLASFLAAYSQDKHDQIFINLINEYRKSIGLNTLTYDPLLDSACKVQCAWMGTVEKINHDIGPHARLEIIDPYYRDKVRQFSIAENCYGVLYENAKTSGIIGVFDSDIKCAFEIWKGSVGHNMAMLIPESTSIGFDIRGNSTINGMGYIIVATMVVGTRADSPVTNIRVE